MDNFHKSLTNEQIELLKQLGSIKLSYNFVSSKIRITLLSNPSKDIEKINEKLSSLQKEFNELYNQGIKLKHDKFVNLTEDEIKIKQLYRKIYSIKSKNSLIEKKSIIDS